MLDRLGRDLGSCSMKTAVGENWHRSARKSTGQRSMSRVTQVMWLCVPKWQQYGAGVGVSIRLLHLLSVDYSGLLGEPEFYHRSSGAAGGN